MRRRQTVLISQSLFDFTSKPEECASVKYHKGLTLKHVWSVLDAACTRWDAQSNLLSPDGEECMTGGWKLRRQLKEAFGKMVTASLLRDLWEVTENILSWSMIKNRLVLSLNDLEDAANLKRVPSLAQTWSLKHECLWRADVRSHSRNLLIWNTQEDKHIKLRSNHHCWSALSASTTLTDKQCYLHLMAMKHDQATFHPNVNKEKGIIICVKWSLCSFVWLVWKTHHLGAIQAGRVFLFQCTTFPLFFYVNTLDRRVWPFASFAAS